MGNFTESTQQLYGDDATISILNNERASNRDRTSRRTLGRGVIFT